MSSAKEVSSIPALPDDCIFEVFQYLSATDLARVSRTCRAWNTLSVKNSLWMHLCLERWKYWSPPSPLAPYGTLQPDTDMEMPEQLDSLLDDLSLKRRPKSRPQHPPQSIPDLHSPMEWFSASFAPLELGSWKNVYQERHDKDRIVRMLLQEVISDSRNRMRHLGGIASIGMVHARDVLENILAGRKGEKKDLTRSYYARKALRRLQRGWVLDQWRLYRLNEMSFPIWQGCGLLSMFSDHEMQLSDLDAQFQELAQEFLAIAPIPSQDDLTSPPSVFSPRAIDHYSQGFLLGMGSGVNSHTFDGPKQDLQEDPLTEKYQRYYDDQVDRLRTLIRFFTKEKGFKGNTENYYDPFNSFIDKVLSRKVGIPISLCIVFAELAQRVNIMGVDLMGFPQHFMIRYRPPVPDPSMFSAHSGSGSPIESESGPKRGSSSSFPSRGHSTPVPPPTYYLDLFHPPHRLLTTDEYEDHFSSLNIPQPANIYRDLPTPPVEIFLRCLRNVILAVEQFGGAGRLGSDHQTSLYAAMTQLLVLHPGEEWNFYVLWLQYLSNFWPEDVGFVRDAIEEMELSEHRRSVSKAQTSLQNPRNHQVFVRGRNSLYGVTHSPSNQQTIKILRGEVRELEMMDEVGAVGLIRRRRRPRVATVQQVEPLLEDPLYAERTSSTQAPTESIDPHSSLAELATSLTSTTEDTEPLSPAEPMDLQEGSPQAEQTADPPQPKPKPQFFGGEERRRPEPEFYVGEVFRHRFYRYTGAIYGYDLKCEAEESWIRSLNIDSLAFGRHQPFYNAILADGSRRYVAQENILVLFRNDARKQVGNDSNSNAEAMEYDTLAGQSSRQNLGGSRTEQTMEEADQSSEGTSHLTAAVTGVSPTSFPETVGGQAGPSSTVAEAPVTEVPVVITDETEIETELEIEEEDNPAGPGAAVAPELNLRPDQFSELGPLEIEDVGKYFEAWDATQGWYTMNQELRKLYPTEDRRF